MDLCERAGNVVTLQKFVDEKRQQVDNKRAVLYYRVSKDEQNCENQKADLHNYCEFRKWLVVRTYCDYGNGTMEWEKVIDLSKKRLADIIVISKISEIPLSDKLTDFDSLRIEDDLRERGAGFFVLQEKIDTLTPEGRLTFCLFLAISEYRRKIGNPC